MSFTTNALFSLAIGLGAIIGWIRYNKLDPAFHPFIWLLWLGLANEIGSIILMKAGYSNAVNNNLFALAEALILTYQFRKWNLFRGQVKLYWFLQYFFVACWLIETFFLRKMIGFNSWFIIGFSAIIVVQSINMLNRVIFEVPGKLIFHPVFLLCMAFIVYFTYSILIEIFWVYGLNRSRFFRVAVYEILAYVNLFTNLVYSLAIIWMPLKRQYIMQS